MPAVSPNIQRLAAELIALEAAGPSRAGPAAPPPVRICENLRTTLTTLVGLPGYRALLSRALALACEEDPSLLKVRVGEDGALEGLDSIPPGDRAGSPARGDLVITHLLGLLATLVGEPLTFRLVRSAWPEAPSSALRPESESQS